MKNPIPASHHFKSIYSDTKSLTVQKATSENNPVQGHTDNHWQFDKVICCQLITFILNKFLRKKQFKKNLAAGIVYRNLVSVRIKYVLPNFINNRYIGKKGKFV